MTITTPPLCADKRADLRESLMRIKTWGLKLLNDGKISQLDYQILLKRVGRVDECIGVIQEDKE